MTQEYDKKTNRNLILIIILLAIALIVAVGYISYGVIKENYYALGFQDGQEFVINQVQNNQIPIVYQNKELNRTEVRYISLGQVCSNILGENEN